MWRLSSPELYPLPFNTAYERPSPAGCPRSLEYPGPVVCSTPSALESRSQNYLHANTNRSASVQSVTRGLLRRVKTSRVGVFFFWPSKAVSNRARLTRGQQTEDRNVGTRQRPRRREGDDNRKRARVQKYDVVYRVRINAPVWRRLDPRGRSTVSSSVGSARRSCAGHRRAENRLCGPGQNKITSRRGPTHPKTRVESQRRRNSYRARTSSRDAGHREHHDPVAHQLRVRSRVAIASKNNRIGTAFVFESDSYTDRRGWAA